MYETPYADSLEARILSATRIELVEILYDAALDAVAAARQYLAQGKIMDRSRKVSQAVGILIELHGSLDRKSVGDLGNRLADLYSYMQRRLLDANFRQSDDGLEETERLLKTLREAWAQVASSTGAPAGVPASAETQATPELPASAWPWPTPSPEGLAASHGWSA
jgi:flagellar secretion chaperone FliS